MAKNFRNNGQVLSVMGLYFITTNQKLFVYFAYSNQDQVLKAFKGYCKAQFIQVNEVVKNSYYP